MYFKNLFIYLINHFNCIVSNYEIFLNFKLKFVIIIKSDTCKFLCFSENILASPSTFPYHWQFLLIVEVIAI